MPDEEEKILSAEEEKQKALDEVEKATLAKQALEDEKKKILEDINTLREERRTLRSEPVVEKPEAPKDEADLNTVEGWTKFIDKKAEEKTSVVSKDIQDLKKAQKSKALKEFVHRHPEYAASFEAKDAMSSALLDTYSRVKSRTDLDADDILEDLEDAWAVKHRDEISKLADETRKAKREAEMLEADVVTSGSSSPVRSEHTSEDEATAEDHRIARSLGKSLKEYLPLKKQYESMQL